MATKNIELYTSYNSFVNQAIVDGKYINVPVTDICCGQDILHFVIKPYKTCEILKCYIVERDNYKNIPITVSTTTNENIVEFDKLITHTDKTSINIQSFKLCIIFSSELGDLRSYERIYQLYVYLPSFVNMVNDVKIVDAQMVDNDNNHILFISENSNNNIFINKLKQTANRKILYQRKKAEKVSVISTNTPQILKGNKGQYYAPHLNNNVDSIFTPLSAYNTNSWVEPKIMDYNQLPGNADKLLELIKNKNF